MKIGRKAVMAAFVCAMAALTGCAENGGAPLVDVDISPILSLQDDTTGNEGLKIGSVIMSNSGEWNSEAIKGMETAAADLGVSLQEQNSSGILGVEEKQIQNFILSGVDAIVCCPISPEETGAALAEAEAAGIPVITWNSTVNADVTAAVRVDSTALGADTGDYLVEYVHTWNLSGLKIGMLTNESYSTGIERCNGFRKAVEELESGGTAAIVSEIPAESAQEAADAVAKMLAEHPDLDVIWCWNQTSLLACLDTVKELGKPELIIMGTEMSVNLAKDMQEDAINLLAVTTQLPYNMGYKAVANAVRAAKGEEVEKSIIIPTFTYVKSDKDGLAQYIESHMVFTK